MLIPTLEVLAEAIKDRRTRCKLSQEQVGQIVGIKQTTVSALENRPEKSKVETLFKVLSALHLELHVVDKDAPEGEQIGKWEQPW
jgi:HTH-type transcriptional regulator/antitoxin HipB